MVSIVVDESFSMGIFCKKMLSVLTAQLKTKRIPYETVYNAKDVAPDIKYAYLVGADITWAKYSISICNKRGIHPILLSFREYVSMTDNTFSQVCTDVVGSMFELVTALNNTGHKRLALYGLNRQSISDMSLLNGYLATVDDASKKNIFYNEGNFERCFEDFLEGDPEIDGVICANDFLGISLARHLKETNPDRLNRIAIISNTDLQITRLYSDVLIVVRYRTSEYGKAAVMLMKMLQKDTCLSSITMSFKWDCSPIYEFFGKKKWDNASHTDESAELLPKEDIFYTDQELTEMMMVEHLLFESDEIDRIIMKELLAGASYEDIAGKHYLAINTIKYHVKKMLDLCGFEKKKELVHLLKTYIPDNWTYSP